MKTTINEKQSFDLLQGLNKLLLDEKLFLRPDISISFLALKLKSNPSYISQLFSSQLQTNFNDYINYLRIAEASSMLRDESLINIHLDDISHKVGFKSRSVFYDAFKKFTGESPAAFRKENLHKIRQVDNQLT